MFENIGILLSLLENCTIKYSKKSVGVDIVADLKCELEETILFISDDYPLYGHYVWHIESVIDSIFSSLSNKDSTQCHINGNDSY